MMTADAYLNDLRHRVSNDLTLLVGVISRQRGQLGQHSAGEILDDTIGAVLCLAQFYRRLYEQQSDTAYVDLPTHIEGIACSLRASYLDRLGIELACTGDPVSAPPGVARDIGLIVTELVANAAKHAFGAAGGRVGVAVLDSPKGLICRVADDGRGVAGDACLAAGGGLSGASRLAAGLGGWVQVDRDGSGGAAFQLVIPHAAPAVTPA